ncbi:hypothetical protein [Paraburkholderia flava]|uniref:hypothetical protein n=1 Tax=Paraburkholderia flava TaxID=2547393 RepID=UPI00105BAE43|nr:hypothetical protein [Paraburkholderia flava]
MKENPVLVRALHPLEPRMATVAEYLADFPDDSSELHTPHTSHAPPRCPLCGDELQLVQLRDRAHTRYFAHIAHERPACPLVNDALPNPLLVDAHAVDPDHERVRRDEFARHWRQHLHAIRQQVPGFTAVRLTRVIEHADVLHVWAWPTLVQADLPYIFLVLAEFIATTPGVPQSAWLRFWFDASVHCVGDLRTGRAGRAAPRLFRLRYRPPRVSMFPGPQHLLACDEVPMNADFLSHGAARLTRAEVMLVESFLGQSVPAHDTAPSPLMR